MLRNAMRLCMAAVAVCGCDGPNAAAPQSAMVLDKAAAGEGYLDEDASDAVAARLRTALVTQDYKACARSLVLLGLRGLPTREVVAAVKEAVNCHGGVPSGEDWPDMAPSHWNTPTGESVLITPRSVTIGVMALDTLARLHGRPPSFDADGLSLRAASQPSAGEGVRNGQ